MVNSIRLRLADLQCLSGAGGLTAGTLSDQTSQFNESDEDNMPTSMITHRHVFQDSGEA